MFNSSDSPALPNRVTAEDEEGARSLSPGGEGVWGTGDTLVELHPLRDGGISVAVRAPAVALRRVRLRWDISQPPDKEVHLLGDHWERGYGDLEWRGIVPERRMPWYAVAFYPEQQIAAGIGVETGAAAFCWWQRDSSGYSLTLDVSNGGRGVLLGDRTLHAATIRFYGGEPGQSPFEVARALCKRLCPAPRLPDHVVYGSNNWYYAYGRSSHEEILHDADILLSRAPGSDNPPYMVIDDGWQANRTAEDWATTQRGPWDLGNARFPDMPGLATALRAKGARPGIWIRPLGAAQGTPENRLLPAARVTDPGAALPILDPSLLEVRAKVMDDVRRLHDWGYQLIKHDWTTCDILGRWGFQMSEALTNHGWHFADRSRTTAEIIHDLYAAIREAAGDTVLIGCNTVGHLGAGLFELQRTGDDTSGREWERTRKMGINTLAFRMAQHDTFFAVDADCVGLTRDVPWHLNRQWLDLLARSGTPLFVSAAPDAVGPEQSAALKEAFAVASQPQPPAEPLDWLYSTCPRRWRLGDEEATYDWYE